MDSAFATHLVLQQCVDHAVSRRLWLRLEGLRSNRDTIVSTSELDNPLKVQRKEARQHRLEMRLFGCVPLHRGVVRMEMGIIADNQGGRREGGRQLSKQTINLATTQNKTVKGILLVAARW